MILLDQENIKIKDVSKGEKNSKELKDEIFNIKTIVEHLERYAILVEYSK